MFEPTADLAQDEEEPGVEKPTPGF
jgi:hypothetical protein